MLRRFVLVTGVVFVALLGALAVAAHFLIWTQQGLDLALRQLGGLRGIRIEVTGAKGTLAGPLAVDRIVVDHAAVYIEVRDARFVARPGTLLAGRVTLTQLNVAHVTVRLKPRPEQPKSELHFLPAWLRIDAPGFRIGDVDVTLASGQRIVARQGTGSLVMSRWRINLDPVDVRGPQGRLAGSLLLRATDPLGVRSNLQGEWRLPGDAFDYRFRVQTRGKLDQLASELHLEAPARLDFSGTLLDLAENPRARGTLRLVDFDGSPWMPPERIPRLSGTITLAAGREGVGLDGTLTSPSVPGQQIRLQGSGRFIERKIDVVGLRLWLPRLGSTLSTHGTVELAGADAPKGTLPQLNLSGDWSALRWPLDDATEAVVASAHGVYTFRGSLPYAITAKAEVSGPALPTTSFDLDGSLDRDGLVLARVDGQTMRGRVHGKGWLRWTGEQPWHFDVEGHSLALAEVRRGVDGHINLKGSITGTGLRADAPWTAQLGALSGTMFGRPLTGRGEISHRNGTFDLRRVRLANGASYADVNGQIGAQALDLDWNVDLRSLAIVADGMTGQLVSRGRARGTPQRPQLTGTAQLYEFKYGGLGIARAEADVDVDSSDGRPSRVTVDAQSIDTGGLQFDLMSAGLEGLTSDHRFTFAFSSPGNEQRRILEFRGGLGAEGSYDFARRSWNGNVTQVDVVFPDGAAQLIQPAALTLGADLQRASPLCLRTDNDARLCVEGEHHPSPQSWRVIYSAQDWPLKRVLRTFFGWREFDGRLQASGWAEQAPGQPWIGGSTVLVHEPVLELPRNKFRTERIRLGSSQLDLFADKGELRAQLDLQVDESTRLTGEAHADRHADLLASPLRGQVQGRSEVIKVLPLLVPEIDRAAGRLEGQVSLTGTLGEPKVNGTFSLRDGVIELYRTNLIVSALRADGEFNGTDLIFDAAGQTARGKLAVDGRFAWPEGVMTGQMRMHGDQLLIADTPDMRVLASPDIVLKSGADGYLVEGEVLIPLARMSPRQLSTSVGASPDERIVGLPDVDDDDPSTADRVRTKVKVVLGDTVRVDAYGLKARLTGDITVSTVPDDVARGNGTISVVEGEYRAFGQDVHITKGLLRFVNAPLNEPQLELTAERVIKDPEVTVAVNVRGTLDKPFISITSTPTMSSNEALSYLLTGRSIDTLQSGEAANVNQAADSLAVSGGSLLLGSLGTRIGLDEVSVERTGDEGDTQVVLGKALSPKLFVSYGISIAEAINTIKLRYTLNDQWAVKAEAGLDQSADFEYRIER